MLFRAWRRGEARGDGMWDRELRFPLRPLDPAGVQWTLLSTASPPVSAILQCALHFGARVIREFTRKLGKLTLFDTAPGSPSQRSASAPQ